MAKERKGISKLRPPEVLGRINAGRGLSGQVETIRRDGVLFTPHNLRQAGLRWMDIGFTPSEDGGETPKAATVMMPGCCDISGNPELVSACR
ncbi:MAG: hypothetical protein HYX99_02040, partial [Chloroflexi bacterium]|nr:hypothetical protein [Chloroflexota bacterium]